MQWLAACSGGDLGKGRCQTWTLALSWSSACTGFSANISPFPLHHLLPHPHCHHHQTNSHRGLKKTHWLLVVQSVPLLSVLTIKTTVKVSVNKNVMNYTDKYVIKCWWAWSEGLTSMVSGVDEWCSWVDEYDSGFHENGQWCSWADEWCWWVWWVVLGWWVWSMVLMSIISGVHVLTSMISGVEYDQWCSWVD